VEGIVFGSLDGWVRVSEKRFYYFLDLRLIVLGWWRGKEAEGVLFHGRCGFG